MTESFVAEAHGTNASTPITLTIPTGVQGQDVAILAGATSTTTASVDAGWSLVGTLQNPISGETNGIWKKVMAGTSGSASSDVGSTVTFTPGAGVKSADALTIWRGVDPANPVNVSGYTSSSPSSGTTAFTGPSVTTTVDGCMIVSVFMDKNSSTPSPNITVPTGYTSRSAALTSSGTGKADCVQASKLATSAGNYGADTWNVDASLGVVGIFSIALNPISTIQTVHPATDVSNSGSPVGVPTSANLYSNIDEVSADSADYVEMPASSTFIVGLAALSDPGVDTGFEVDYELGFGVGAATATYTITLLQGATTRSGPWTETVTADAGGVITHAISSGDAAGIVFTAGVASDLRLKFEMTTLA